MKSVLKILAVCLLALPLLAGALHIANSGTVPVPPQPPGSVRVATHNVHYILLNEKTGPWSVGDWDRRKDAIDAAFKAIGADIIAFQEMESFAGGDDDSVNLARSHLLENNPGYAAAAIGDWREFPSTQPVFYRKDRFRVLDQGWYFFSETPEVIYSRTFNGSYPAFASWVRFAPRAGGRAFTLVNVHLDYGSRSNRSRSAALIAERTAARIAVGETVILAGDLNARAGSRLVRVLERTGLGFFPVAGTTYHFNRGLNLFGAIDHIGATPDVVLSQGPVVLRQRFGRAWPSDHYPVFADVTLPD